MPTESSVIPFIPKAEIEQRALALLKEHGLLHIPVDPVRLAHAMNIKVFNAKFSDDTISGILAKRGPTLTMLINASDSANRKRFTIAHELGHRVLDHFASLESDHTDHVGDLFRSDQDVSADRAEVQANFFAAALLMPEPLVREEFQKSREIDVLATRFAVSSESMGYRLSNLRLV